MENLYYNIGEIETIDIINSKLSTDEFKGFCKGNILKYITRASYKKSGEDESQDYEKALYYCKKLIDHSLINKKPQ